MKYPKNPTKKDIRQLLRHYSQLKLRLYKSTENQERIQLIHELSKLTELAEIWLENAI